MNHFLEWHVITLGRFGGTFYVMIAQKLAILLLPISIFYHAGASKRPLKHNTKHKKHKTHNNQHEPPLPYPPAALSSFAMATSTMASNQGTVAHCESVAGTQWRVRARNCLSLCLGGTDAYPIKNRAMGVALFLGGCRFMIQHHNQPNSWRSGRGDARVEARGGGERVGGRCPIVWTVKSIDKKYQK